MASRMAGHNAGLLRRLARLSGLIGVTLVFVANFLNDHAVARLQRDTQNVDAVQSDAAQATEAARAGLDQVNAAERISVLEAEVASLTSGSTREEVQSRIGSYELYYSTLNSSVAVLSETMEATNTIGDRGIVLDADTVMALTTARETVASMQADLKEKTQELTDRKEAHQAADTDEEADRIAEELDQSLKALAPLEDQYKETGTQISGLFDMIETQVAAKQDESRTLASFMDYVVYLLSAAGAAIAGFGNWLGARLPRAEGVPTQDVMAGV